MRRRLKRLMPDPRVLLESRYLRVFGKLLHDPNLWHLNRRSASGAVALALFVIYLPPVAHTLVAAGAAIWLRVNLPIAVALVYISNPLTIPPMFYVAFVIGCWVLGHPVPPFEIDFWLDYHNWLEVLAPLALGSLICAILCSFAGYWTVQLLWRWSLLREIKRRRARMSAAATVLPAAETKP